MGMRLGNCLETSEQPVPRNNPFDQLNANWWEGGQKTKVGDVFTPRRLDTPLIKWLGNLAEGEEPHAN